MRPLTTLVVGLVLVGSLASVGYTHYRPPLPVGVQMSPEEARACQAEGCTVWTEAELHEFAKMIYLQAIQTRQRINP